MNTASIPNAEQRLLGDAPSMPRGFEKSALLPCIVQDAETQKVLMLAYMSPESYQITASSGELTFYSRSRQALWVKGATSGNRLSLRSLTLDCDEDTLLAQVVPSGPVCHTGAKTCFEAASTASAVSTASAASILGRLFDCVLDRKKEPKPGSYTNYLFDEGMDKMLKKVGEEAAEVIIASKNASETAVAEEMADLVYHLWVVLAELEMTPAAIYQVLEKRHLSK